MLCAESFSALLQKAEVQDDIGGIRVCRATPKVSHLFLADDTLIFAKVDMREYEGILEIMNKYRVTSGQCINLENLSILLSPNMTDL